TARALEVTAEDRILTTVPLFHSYGFDCGLALALRFGATLYLEDEVAPKRIVKLLREQEINLLPGTPSLYAGLAKLPTAKALKIKGARYLSGGAALSDAIADSFRERWGVKLISAYHMTETGLIACDKRPSGDSGGSIDKAGRISLFGREDHLVKVDGKRVALGEVESCLESFPKVQRAQARVITDPLGGPMVVARVVVHGKCGAEEIIDHCAKNLAPYK